MGVLDFGYKFIQLAGNSRKYIFFRAVVAHTQIYINYRVIRLFLHFKVIINYTLDFPNICTLPSPQVLAYRQFLLPSCLHLSITYFLLKGLILYFWSDGEVFKMAEMMVIATK